LCGVGEGYSVLDLGVSESAEVFAFSHAVSPYSGRKCPRDGGI
jgi:hypothetical protein